MDIEALSLLADVLPPVAVPEHARARFHAELHGAQRFAPLAQEIAELFSVPLPTLQAALARVDDESAWIALPAPGPQLLPVQGRVVLSRLAAGTRIPHHAHKARELTYVLDGIIVSDGVEHGRSECMDMAPGTAHALHVSDDDDCLVVFASLSAL
jgi:quercetin dioxygenase-like cupin family protein